MELRTAILVDGGFYRKRAYYFWGDIGPRNRANELEEYCKKHIKKGTEQRSLYRIFYYDCPPIQSKIYHPLYKKTVDLSKTDMYTWSNDFFEELKHRRKFALRLGELATEQVKYNLKPDITKKLLNGNAELSSLTANDFILNVTQKGVDMKIGIDIASLSYKKQVDQIVLIAGDSDFVPAAKLARREGIDFILDNMRSPIKDSLFEHIDGIRTFAPNK